MKALKPVHYALLVLILAQAQQNVRLAPLDHTPVKALKPVHYALPEPIQVLVPRNARRVLMALFQVLALPLVLFAKLAPLKMVQTQPVSPVIQDMCLTPVL